MADLDAAVFHLDLDQSSLTRIVKAQGKEAS
jgi:hypothetical protein